MNEDAGRASSLIFSRSSLTQAPSWIWHLVPGVSLGRNTERLPWLQRASPSATLDKSAAKLSTPSWCVNGFFQTGNPNRPRRRRPLSSSSGARNEDENDDEDDFSFTTSHFRRAQFI